MSRLTRIDGTGLSGTYKTVKRSTTRRRPLLGGVDTISLGDRKFSDCEMALADVTRQSPSRCLREIGRYAVIEVARQYERVR